MDHEIQYHAREKNIDLDQLIKFGRDIHLAISDIWNAIKADLIRAILEFVVDNSWSGSFMRGRIESEKGLAIVLRKFPLVKVNDSNFQLKLMYTGHTALDGILALVKSLVLDEHIPKGDKIFTFDEQALLDSNASNR